MLPITELRLAIPVAMLVYDVAAFPAAALGVAGNLVPIVVLVWGLEPVSRVARQWRPLDRFFERLFAHTRARHERRFERFRDFALVSLVAIPLPFTGGYTGALAAFVFGVPRHRAFALVTLGICVAAAAVTALVATGSFFFGVRSG